MKRIEIDTFLEYQFVGQPCFSPGGGQVAFIVSQADLKLNGYGRDLYAYDCKTKSVVRLTMGRQVGTYMWRDETRIIFCTAAGEGTDFFEICTDGGEARKIFDVPIKVTAIKPFVPDTLVLVGSVAVHGKPMEAEDGAYEIIEEVPFWGNGRGFTHRQRQGLFVYDEKRKLLDKVTKTWEDCSFVAVYGNQILYTSSVWKDVKGVYPRVAVYEHKNNSVLELIPENTLSVGVIGFLDHERAIIAGAPKDTPYKLNKYKDFYELNLRTRKLTPKLAYGKSIGENTVGSDARMGGGACVKAADGKIYFLTTLEESGYLRCVDTKKISPGNRDGAQTWCLSENLTPPGSCDSFDVFKDHVAYCGMYGDELSQVYVDGEQVTHFTPMDAYTVAPRHYEQVQSFDGTMIHGFVMEPVGCKPDQKYPAILHIHGGPKTVFGSVFHHEMQVWANAGYYVFFCNPRGSDGRGDDFAHIDGHYGTVDYEDIMAFTDAILLRYPQIDKERLGVAGGSYGGFMTNWIVGHTHRFKAAVSQRSVTNWISMEFMSDIGHFFVPQSTGASAFEDAGRLWEQSPLKYAGNCTTPTLFIHSDEDYRCPLAEGIQMYCALKLSGCETRLCVFKGENHELSRSGRPSRRIRRMQEILEWMDKYLKGGQV